MDKGKLLFKRQSGLALLARASSTNTELIYRYEQSYYLRIPTEDALSQRDLRYSEIGLASGKSRAEAAADPKWLASEGSILP